MGKDYPEVESGLVRTDDDPDTDEQLTPDDKAELEGNEPVSPEPAPEVDPEP